MPAEFGAITFDGTDFVTVAHHASHNVGKNKPLSIEGFFKTAAAGPIANKHDGTNGWKLEVLANGSVQATLNATTITAGSALLDDAWHEVAVIVDRKQRKAFLFIDGEADIPTDISSLDTLDSTATIYLGRDGASYLTGSIAEFRLSDSSRLGQPGSTTTYSVPVTQFADDLNTIGLWHFNEGRGTVFHDASINRVNGTYSGSTVTWALGPCLSNPLQVCLEQLWWSLDQDANLTNYLNARNGHKYRMRNGEPFPEVFSAEHCPALTVYPTSWDEAVPDTYGDIYRLQLAFAIEGILFAAGIAELGAFTHFTWRAILDNWLDNDAESWQEYIQNIQFPRPPQWWASPEPDNQFLGRFKLTVLIEYRVPRRP